MFQQVREDSKPCLISESFKELHFTIKHNYMDIWAHVHIYLMAVYSNLLVAETCFLQMTINLLGTILLLSLSKK